MPCVIFGVTAADLASPNLTAGWSLQRIPCARSDRRTATPAGDTGSTSGYSILWGLRSYRVASLSHLQMTEWLPSVTWDVASFAEDDTAVQAAHKVQRILTCACLRNFQPENSVDRNMQVSKTVAKKRASKARAIEKLSENVILFDTSIKGINCQSKGQLSRQTEHFGPDTAQPDATVQADLAVQLQRPQVSTKSRQQEADVPRETEVEIIDDPTRVSVKV